MTMNYSALDALCMECGITNIENENLAGHVSFKIGGPADRYIIVKSVDELKKVLACIKENNIRYFLLGNGSDLLVADEGFRGVVIRLGGDFNKVEILEDGVTLKVGAGATLAAACICAKENELTGLEFAWGIPGSLGGACYMNAGAYGGEMKDVLTVAEFVNPDGSDGKFEGDELGLSYRHSAFTDSDKIITFMYLKLAKGKREEIVAKMEDLLGRRKSKQPVEYPSAGSTFKRPEGYFAAALIEECGLKGEHVGDAEVSEKHSGFIINKGKATCKDVCELIDRVKAVVLEKKGVELECEVILLK
ncbi:MAG: UDP-N-acetylmuramate dehydrogenase [Clostridia bacterium]|nr:UDP-N-acetylmuramate dehydrogenase [Clostridia bacterium]